MSIGRAVSATAASLAVIGCGALAIAMASVQTTSAAKPRHSPSAPAPTARPAYLAEPEVAMPSSIGAGPTGRPSSSGAPSSSARVSAPATTAAVRTTPAVAAAPNPVATHRTAPRPVARPAAVAKPKARPVARPVIEVAPARGQSLPVRYSTGSATRVITVVARSSRATTATLQAWTKAAGGGWTKYGASVTANVGADGIGSASESTSTTPAGSWTLTQAFGYYSDPGTPLPYFKTTRADWWVSQSGKYYNTHRHCSSGCGFNTETSNPDNNPNEHLVTETPYYNYAVVIDYNTRNAPGGIKPGAGSAFFLHVEHGGATAGCVSIPQSKLVSLMRWLSPSAHPRILIGVT